MDVIISSSILLQIDILLTDMIYENNPITNTFVSLPLDLSQFNCATFIAGIIAGILDSAKFVSFLSSFHSPLFIIVMDFSGCQCYCPFPYSS